MLFPIALSMVMLAGCQPHADQAADATAASTPPAAQEPKPDEQLREYRFDCDGTPITARYFGHERVEVSVNALLLILKPVESADGARYADDLGNELWTRGNDSGTLKLASDPEPKPCTAAKDTPAA